MESIFCETCDNSSLISAIDRFGTDSTLLVLVTDDNSFDEEELDKYLKNAPCKIIGGIYPKIIYQNKLVSKGLIVAKIKDDLDITILENISEQNDFDPLVEKINIDNTKTLFVLVDGLSKNIAGIIKSLFDNFGLTINYVGGGAGSLSFVQRPVLFTNKGLLQDACILASSSLASSVGVKHGWQSVSEPFKVTKSVGTTIVELDFKNAFEVYKSIVEPIAGVEFNNENFFDIAKGFPFGINKISGEMVVRDPIIGSNDGLVCVGEVPNGSFVNILQGVNDNLVNAAFDANKEAKDSCNFQYSTLFIDCISRVLFLESDFQRELDAIYSGTSEMIGMLTLGEIANNKKYYLEFYNKTAVVAKIENK